MTFPQTPLDVRIDLRINGVWTDITRDVYTAEKITITRGRADEGARVDPGKCSLTLNNGASKVAPGVLGRYSPRNPRSDLYGLIGRNTPIRVSVPGPVSYLELDGHGANSASTPDTAALDITGDLDMRWEGEADWYAPGAQILIGKWGAAGNRSYHMRLQDGFLYLLITQDGTSGFAANWRLPALPRHAALRVTLDVDNGIAGSDWTFYWAPTISGPWTQFGFVRITSGAISIFPTSAPLSIAPEQLDSSPPRTAVKGRVHKAEVRSGINGTIVANPDFTSQMPGTTGFTDGAGRAWSLAGTAVISNRKNRFVGEVSSWPSRWDVSGNDVRVPIEAAGILRRLGQGSSPVQSTMRREFSNPARTGIIAYWPCEEGPAATSVASGLPGGPLMRVVKSGVSFAASDTWPASDALPTMQTGTVRGQVPSYASTGEVAVRLFMQLPDSGLQAAAQLFSLGTTGSIRTWEVWVDPSAHLRVRALDSDGTQLYDSGYLDMTTTNQGGPAVVNGARISLNLALVQDGSSVDWNLTGINIDQSTLTNGPLKSLAFSVAGTLGVARQMGINETANLGDTVIGHVAIANDTGAYASTLAALVAQAGETAVDRIMRLRAENQLTVFIERGNDPSALMGPQSVDTLLNLLEEAAAVDGGILGELRDGIGLIYRDRQTLYNQTPALLLDYATDGHVAPPLEPVDDDQKVRNQVTVTRSGGSFGQAVLEDGPLSIQDPPSGVGVYDDSVTLNLYSDDQATQHAGWRLHLGTVDEARYPSINVDLAAAPDLIDQVTALDAGDRVQIAHPPAWLPPDAIDQLAQGYQEVIGHPIDWDFQLNCTPAAPWTVAVADDVVLGKADTDGSELAAPVDADDTLLSVAVTAGPLWTPSAAEYPFDIRVGGEVMTVKAVGQILNANPSFDTNVSGWTATSGTIAWALSSTRQSGACVLTTNGGAQPRFEVNTKATGITPGAQYRASGLIFTSGALSAGVGINVNWYDSGGTYLSTSSNQRVPGVGVWDVWDAVFTAPASAARAGILLACSGTPGAGIQVWGDDIYLRPVSSYNASPQSMTVVRSVNGIVKSQSSGTDLRLAQPAVAAL